MSIFAIFFFFISIVCLAIGLVVYFVSNQWPLVDATVTAIRYDKYADPKNADKFISILTVNYTYTFNGVNYSQSLFGTTGNIGAGKSPNREYEQTLLNTKTANSQELKDQVAGWKSTRDSEFEKQVYPNKGDAVSFRINPSNPKETKIELPYQNMRLVLSYFVLGVGLLAGIIGVILTFFLHK